MAKAGPGIQHGNQWLSLGSESFKQFELVNSYVYRTWLIAKFSANHIDYIVCVKYRWLLN